MKKKILKGALGERPTDGLEQLQTIMWKYSVLSIVNPTTDSIQQERIFAKAFMANSLGWDGMRTMVPNDAIQRIFEPTSQPARPTDQQRQTDKPKSLVRHNVLWEEDIVFHRAEDWKHSIMAPHLHLFKLDGGEEWEAYSNEIVHCVDLFLPQ